MTNKEFDKIFRDKLSGHRTPVDGGMWRSIEAGLGRRKAAAYVAAAAAAAVILIAVLISTENKSHLPIKTNDAGPAQAQAPVLQPEKTILVADLTTLTDKAKEPRTKEPRTTEPTTEGLLESQMLEKSEKSEISEKSERSEMSQMLEKSEMSEISEISERSEKSGKSQMLEKSGRSEASGVVSSVEISSVEVSSVEVSGTAESSAFAEVSNAAGESHAAEVPLMAGLPMEEEDCLGTMEKKMRSFSLFSNVAPRTDITAFSNHYGVMASSGISHTSSELQGMEIISQAKHSLPLNLGVQIQFELGDKTSAGVGLSYTRLRSRYEALVNKKFHNVKQSLHYIGVPVNFYFSIIRKRNLKIYANVGGAVEKGVKASFRLTSYDGTSRSATAAIEGFQYSANFGMGLEYMFSDHGGIYLEPNAVYFFDSKVPASVRTDQPFQLKAEIGLRFHL